MPHGKDMVKGKLMGKVCRGNGEDKEDGGWCSGAGMVRSEGMSLGRVGAVSWGEGVGGGRGGGEVTVATPRASSWVEAGRRAGTGLPTSPPSDTNNNINNLLSLST